MTFQLDASTRSTLFGAEDAENETPDRFKQYFFVNRVYDDIRSDLPIRLIVGPKGVGKSAILKRSYLQDIEDEKPAIWLRPSDILPSDIDSKFDFNRRVRSWHNSIRQAIVEKLFSALVDDFSFDKSKYVKRGGAVVQLIHSIASDYIRSKSSKFDNLALEIIKDGEYFSIYIDDIDRGWEAKEADVANISALLNAVRDFSGLEPGLRFRIAIRSDVYFLVRTSDESTDKIEQHISWLRWSNDDVLRILAKRICTYFNVEKNEEQIRQMSQAQISRGILSFVIEERFVGAGHWSNRHIHNVLLSLTRERPRDLVKLMQGAATIAYQRGSNHIKSVHLEDSFPSYSEERLRDVINEHKTEVPEIERLLLEMKPTKKTVKTSESFKFTNDGLSKKISQIRGHVNVVFSNKRAVTNRSITQFLYKIGFITARKDNDEGIDRKSFDQAKFLAHEFVDFGYDWEIHPAYRWALQPQDVHMVIESLKD